MEGEARVTSSTKQQNYPVPTRSPSLALIQVDVPNKYAFSTDVRRAEPQYLTFRRARPALGEETASPDAVVRNPRPHGWRRVKSKAPRGVHIASASHVDTRAQMWVAELMMNLVGNGEV